MSDRFYNYCQRLDEIGFRVMRRIFQEISDLLEEGMTPPQFMVMRLVDRKGAATVSEISEAMGVTLSAVTPLADRLAASNYMLRERDAVDRRVVLLRLTDTGQQKLASMEARRLELIRRYLGQLPEEDVERLLSIFEQLASIMENGGITSGTTAHLD